MWKTYKWKLSKNLSLLFIACILFQLTAFAQQGWIEQTSGTIWPLTAVSFIDSDNGTAVGYEGTILRTTDGGTTWTSQTSVTKNHLEGVSFTDSNNGTVVGQYGTILRTTDGGTTWTSQSSGPTERLNAVSFIDSDNGTVVGQYGTILRTTNGGVSFVKEEEIEEIPTDYTLSQNYPNPFNPSTSIQYAVSSRQFVSLKVYDLLGREIATIVNEEKPAGNYEVSFDAANLTSGIYLYKIQSGDPSSGSGQSYTDVKKMILLR